MAFDQTDTNVTLTHAPVSDLLPPAFARLQRQAQYARALKRGGNRAAGLQGWFRQASDCISALAQPVIALKPLKADLCATGTLIADRILIEDPSLADDIAHGGTVTAYLVTLGFSQHHAFDWLGQDYGAHHIQSDLSNEVLFELARIAHRLQRQQTTSGRLKRISVQVSDVCGTRKVWDPQKVQSLLSVFDETSVQVSVTDTGCFQPLNTILGLTVHL